MIQCLGTHFGGNRIGMKFLGRCNSISTILALKLSGRNPGVHFVMFYNLHVRLRDLFIIFV